RQRDRDPGRFSRLRDERISPAQWSCRRRAAHTVAAALPEPCARGTGEWAMRKPYVGPSFMGGTLSAAEVQLAMGLYLRPLAREPGSAVDAFERAFAQAVHAPHATAFGTGRVALWAILHALGLDEEDEVVLP